MIERPRRAVTRFFIPLIDVLILLFCIFLLMPFLKQGEAAETPLTPDDPAAATSQTSQNDLQQQLQKARMEIARLRAEQVNPSEKFSFAALEVDGRNGLLYWYHRGQPSLIADEAAAAEVIDTEKKIAGIQKDPFLIIVLPHELTGFPTQPQLDQYTRWFRNVSFRIYNPLGDTSQ